MYTCIKNYSLMKQIPLYLIVILLATSCSGNGGRKIQSIEFLGRSDCSHSPAMEKSLIAAIEKRGMGNQYKYINLASLPVDDHRRGYGSPTVLINGEDLFGMPRPKPTRAAPV